MVALIRGYYGCTALMDGQSKLVRSDARPTHSRGTRWCFWAVLGGTAFALTFGVLRLEWSHRAFWLVTNIMWYWVLPGSLHAEYTPLGHPIGYVISVVVCSGVIGGCLRLIWTVLVRLTAKIFSRS